MDSMWSGDDVRLRGVEPNDWSDFQALAEYTVDVRNADSVEPPQSAESWRSWTAERAARAPGAEAFRLVVETTDDATFVGSLTVGETDRRAGRFKLGIEIARGHRRRGYATDAISLTLAYMFAEQRLNKCEVEVHAFNQASIALFRGLGFTEEGRLRQHEYFAGAFHDVIVLGITAEEFWSTRPKPAIT